MTIANSSLQQMYSSKMQSAIVHMHCNLRFLRSDASRQARSQVLRFAGAKYISGGQDFSFCYIF